MRLRRREAGGSCLDVHQMIRTRNLLRHGGHFQRGERSVRRIVEIVALEDVS